MEGSDEEHTDTINAFDKSQYEGKKGHLLLQLQKTYKGDDRFQLAGDKDFDIDLHDAAKTKKQLPQAMLGALSKREANLLNEDEHEVKKKKVYTIILTI